MAENPMQPASFPSLREVSSHLRVAGFKISKSTVQRHVKKGGMLQQQADGSFLQSDVELYAHKYLERVDGSLEHLSDVHARKAAKEVESLEYKIKKQKFEYEKEQGKYIPRKDFEAELAARGVVLDSGFTHVFSVRASEWIALVGGKVEKTADFLQALNQAKDEQLNKYASTDVFQVIFEDED